MFGRRCRRMCLPLGLLLTLALRVPAPAADEDLDTELHMARGLVELGLPDYARLLVERLELKYPEIKPRTAPIRVDILLKQGRVQEAVELFKTLELSPEEKEAKELEIADYWYGVGQFKEAREIYDAFFRKYAQGALPEGLREFFAASAYRYAQMLIYMGDEKAAVAMFERLLAAGPDRMVRRQVQTETAELCLKIGGAASGKERDEYLGKADKLANDVTYGGNDLWFGKAVVIMAHVRMEQDDTPAAIELIRRYLPDLANIDQQLKDDYPELRRMSPMAECRYLLGSLQQEEAERQLADGNRQAAYELLAGKGEGDEKKIGALQHLYNVFVKYSESPWAVDAGRRSERVIGLLESEFGREVNIPPIDLGAVIAKQFQSATVLYRNQDFQGAVDKFIAVLALFPEYEASVEGLGHLAECYVELGEELYAQMVINYLIERFSATPDLSEAAGDALLKVAERYWDRGQPERSSDVNARFFQSFPNHPRAARALFGLGDKRLREENYDVALQHFQDLVENHPDSPFVLDAKSLMATCYAGLDQHSNAVRVLTGLIAELEPSQRLISARYRLADSHRVLGHYAEALKEYADIITLLEPRENRYTRTADEARLNEDLVRNATFWKAFCFSKLSEPADQVPLYRRQAVEIYRQFVADNPDSRLAPSALSSMGALLLIEDKSAEANAVYDRLAKEYPESEQAKNAYFAQVQALLALGEKRRAAEVFDRMLATSETFTPAQFLRLGDMLLAGGESEGARKAFRQTIDSTDDELVKQAAMLGMGNAHAAASNHAATVEAMSALLAAYPQTGYVVPASYALVDAHQHLALAAADPAQRERHFAEAMKALRPIYKLAGTAGERARAELTLAEVQGAQGSEMECLTSLQRLFLLGDSTDAEARPYLERAFELSVPLLMDKGRYDDVIENVERYLKIFPQGRLVEQARRWRDTATLRKVTGGGGAAP